MTMEKRGVIEPGWTPPEGAGCGESPIGKDMLEKLADHVTSRAAAAVETTSPLVVALANSIGGNAKNS